MEEAGDEGGEGVVEIVDEGIEETGRNTSRTGGYTSRTGRNTRMRTSRNTRMRTGGYTGMRRDAVISEGGLRKDVVVGDGGGDEGGGTLPQRNFITCRADAEGAVALDAHGDDEAVVFAEVAVEGTRDLGHADIEIGGVDNLDGAIGGVGILCAVVGFDVEVEGLGCQGGMELAGLAVHAGAVVVEDAVGDVGGLLDFCEQDAATDGVDAASGEVEHVACLNLVVGEDLGDAAVLYALLVLVGGDVLLEAGIEVGAWVSLDDVPHLGLAHLAVEALRQGIVGVDLYAEVFFCINEFD